MISYDGGKSFSSLGISSMEYDLSSSYIYFHVTKNQTVLVFISDQGLFESDNLGRTWVNCTYNLPSTLVNSFYATDNGTSYVATYGAGIFEDTNLLNLSFYQSRPILSGYIPTGSNATIDDKRVSGPGYFTFGIRAGTNSIVWKGENMNFSAVDGNIYFLNFTSIRVYYSVTFEESGLPSGFEWSVTLNGTTESSTTNTITFTEPYGTYSFSVTLPSGYKTTTPTGTVTTTQSSTNVPISVTSVTKTTTPPATTNYLLIGVIVAVVVIIALIAAVIVMRRGKNRGREPDKLQEPPSQLPPKG